MLTNVASSLIVSSPPSCGVDGRGPERDRRASGGCGTESPFVGGPPGRRSSGSRRLERDGSDEESAGSDGAAPRSLSRGSLGARRNSGGALRGGASASGGGAGCVRPGSAGVLRSGVGFSAPAPASDRPLSGGRSKGGASRRRSVFGCPVCCCALARTAGRSRLS